MGNICSIDNDTTCSICNKHIVYDDLLWCKCIQCNIMLHNECEKKYRGEKKYCECPKCHRIGTIGSYITPLQK